MGTYTHVQPCTNLCILMNTLVLIVLLLHCALENIKIGLINYIIHRQVETDQDSQLVTYPNRTVMSLYQLYQILY